MNKDFLKTDGFIVNFRHATFAINKTLPLNNTSNHQIYSASELHLIL